MDITIALYSHDSVGLGHARRNRALAYALAERLPALTGGTVGGLLIAGHPDASRDPLPEGWDWLVLPGMTRTRGGYGARRLAMDASPLRDLRSATIDAALTALQPDLFIADRHPFGIDGELRPVLENLRARGTATVLGLREVLDTPRVAAAEWDALGGAEHVASYLDAIWVYGDPHVYDPRRTGELPPALSAKAATTGYLAHGRPAARLAHPDRSSPKPPPPYVLTVLGGGADGAELARLAAVARLPEGHRHLLVTGPQMPEQDITGIRELAATSEDTTVVRSAPDVPELIAEAAAVVCMGGYNTMAEVMATDTPALVVPRNRRRQEQSRRALALAAAGAVETCDPASVTSTDITNWWSRAVTGRTDRSHIHLDGLDVVAHLAARLLPATVPAHSEVLHHVG